MLFLLVVIVLVGIGIVGIGRIALIILRLLDLAVQRIVIARGIGWLLLGVLRLFRVLIVRLLRWQWRRRRRRGLLPAIALQRMHRRRLIIRLVVILRLERSD